MQHACCYNTAPYDTSRATLRTLQYPLNCHVYISTICLVDKLAESCALRPPKYGLGCSLAFPRASPQQGFGGGCMSANTGCQGEGLSSPTAAQLRWTDGFTFDHYP
eukprot:jgi/Chrzof1/5159/Cz15g13210.t1